ncbi:MAG: flagellar basal body rod protein FlgB [Desulfobacterales bacterium]|nr:flagellar basal body rod protein FlgB [Desulfobacterales bacterium]
MEPQEIFGGTISLLEKTLDLRSMRHNLIISNVANMDTPNYKAFDIIIKEELEKTMGAENAIKLENTRSGHLPGRAECPGNVKSRASGNQQITLRNDGNSVDVDREMAKLSENNLMYNALAQIISRKFAGLKDVIKG